MKRIILFIDTSSNKEIKAGLEIDGKKNIINKPLDTRKAQAVLPMIEELFKKYKLEFKDISEIKVNPGPGSFTGIRVGVSIANALGFLLKIPVNGKEAVEPVYK